VDDIDDIDDINDIDNECGRIRTDQGRIV